MKYNTFLINGLLLTILAVITISMQWQSKTIYDGMAKPAMAVNVAHNNGILSAPPSSELH